MNAPILRVAALASLVFGCQSETPAPSATPRSQAEVAPMSTPPTTEAAVVPATPGVQGDGTVVFAVKWWDGSLESALAQAKRQNKRVFAKVGAYWCPPCQRLDEEVFVDEEVAARLAERYVPVYIEADVEDGPEVVAQYHIQAFPTILVLDPSGLERGRIVDFVAKPDLLAAMQRIETGEGVLADLERAVAANPDDAERRYALGHAYALAANKKQAEAAFASVLLADPKDEMGLASKVAFDQATYLRHKLDGDREGAIATLRHLKSQFPESEAARKSDRYIGRLQHALGRSDEAIETLDGMLARAGDSRDAAVSYGWFSFRERCRPERGLQVVEAALQRHGDDAELHYLRAELAHVLGRDDDARRSIQRAAELEPQSMFYRRQARRFDEAKG